MNSFRKNSFSFVFLPALTIRVAASFLYINTLAAFQERRCEVFYYSLPTMHLSRQNHAQEQTARCSAYSLCQALRVTVKFCATCQRRQSMQHLVPLYVTALKESPVLFRYTQSQVPLEVAKAALQCSLYNRINTECTLCLLLLQHQR